MKRIFFTMVAVIFCWAGAMAGDATLIVTALCAPVGLEAATVNVLGFNAELLKRQFLTEITPQIFPENGWESRSVNDDEYVNGDSVNLAHAGELPEAQVNRQVVPAQVAPRTDIATGYEIEEITTDPTGIKDSEALVVSYNKRQSVMEQHVESQNYKIAERLLNKWGSDAVSKLFTTGVARDAYYGNQTGQRRRMTKGDFIRVLMEFYKMDIISKGKEAGGVCVLTPGFYSDIMETAEFTDADKVGRPVMPSGVVTHILGFDIYVRSRALFLNAADELKAEGAASAADDQNCALFWHEKYVRRARGGVKTYMDIDGATTYGTTISTMSRMGAKARRNDGKGLVLLAEDNV